MDFNAFAAGHPYGVSGHRIQFEMTLRANMFVDRFELSLDRLDGHVSEDAVGRGVGLPPHCRLKGTVRPDDMTILAMDDGVVGRGVGHLKDGTPAFQALYLEADGCFRHGPVILDWPST